MQRQGQQSQLPAWQALTKVLSPDSAYCTTSTSITIRRTHLTYGRGMALFIVAAQRTFGVPWVKVVRGEYEQVGVLVIRELV